MTVSLSKLIGAVAQPLVDRVRGWVPGKVVSYDASKRRALVHTNARIIVQGDDGEDEEVSLPDADMPVAFDKGGGFIVAFPLNVGDAGRIYYSHLNLDQWKGDGQEHAVRPGRWGFGDAVFCPGLDDYGHPGFVPPDGVMVMGAENGPQVLVDTVNMTIELRSINEVRILGQARVRIESDGDVFIQKRWVDPTGGDL